MLITTSGPGITNAITALATAYADSVPILAISPGPPRGQVGADVGWLHEVKNQQAALDAVCGRSIRVESADEIPEVLATVFEQFETSRPRPVHLEVPVDVLEGPWDRRPVPVNTIPAPVGPPRATVEEIAAALDGSRRPLLVAGGGARGAAEQVLALAEYGVPVLTTVNGKGVLDESHPAALGAGIRLAAAHRALNDADLLIVVGSELGDSDLWGGVVAPGEPGRRTVVRIDLDPAQMHKNVRRRPPRRRRRVGRPGRPARRTAGEGVRTARSWRPPLATRSRPTRPPTRDPGSRSSRCSSPRCQRTRSWRATARR